jgi:hypothetical protein
MTPFDPSWPRSYLAPSWPHFNHLLAFISVHSWSFFWPIVIKGPSSITVVDRLQPSPLAAIYSKFSASIVAYHFKKKGQTQGFKIFHFEFEGVVREYIFYIIEIEYDKRIYDEIV